MLNDEWVYVGHMLALEISSGKDKETYNQDLTLRLALTHLVQVIGEAAQRVSNTFRDAYADVPWREIIGMRHRIVHDYLNVDEDVVWQVVQDDLPLLVEKLNRIIPPEYL
ncbi:MAG: DUF86 domain-containing protein [Methanothrix sp.]|nr:MAG: DUF86 domain-containing protein [Methanothrix sp.]